MKSFNTIVPSRGNLATVVALLTVWALAGAGPASEAARLRLKPPNLAVSVMLRDYEQARRPVFTLTFTNPNFVPLLVTTDPMMLQWQVKYGRRKIKPDLVTVSRVPPASTAQMHLVTIPPFETISFVLPLSFGDGNIPPCCLVDWGRAKKPGPHYRLHPFVDLGAYTVKVSYEYRPSNPADGVFSGKVTSNSLRFTLEP